MEKVMSGNENSNNNKDKNKSILKISSYFVGAITVIVICNYLLIDSKNINYEQVKTQLNTKSDTTIVDSVMYVTKDFSNEHLIKITESANSIFNQYFSLYTLLIAVLLIAFGIILPIIMQNIANKRNDEEVNKLKTQVEDFKSSFEDIKIENEALKEELNKKIEESDSNSKQNSELIKSNLLNLENKINEDFIQIEKRIQKFVSHYNMSTNINAASLHLITGRLNYERNKIGGAFREYVRAYKFFLLSKSSIHLDNIYFNFEYHLFKILNNDKDKLTGNDIFEINHTISDFEELKLMLDDYEKVSFINEILKTYNLLLEIFEKFKTKNIIP